MVSKSLISRSGSGSVGGGGAEKVFSRDDILGFIFFCASVEGTQADGSDMRCLYR